MCTESLFLRRIARIIQIPIYFLFFIKQLKKTIMKIIFYSSLRLLYRRNMNAETAAEKETN
jgi:hypothetical protein